MTLTLDLDAVLELLHPHKPLPRDILARTDTHQYLAYLVHHASACISCPAQVECPPCPYDAPGGRPAWSS